MLKCRPFSSAIDVETEGTAVCSVEHHKLTQQVLLLEQ